ncbi:MAG: ATP-binding protein [Candidatus Omnitrophota bacterium]
MNRDQLLKRLSGIEWDDFEVKEARVALPDDIAKTISAFSNTTGGHIVFGVKDNDGKFTIGGVESPDKIQNDFIMLLRGEKFNIPLSSKGDVHHIDGKAVLVFRIEEMPRQAKPVYFNGDIRNTFVRIGASTQKASKPEVERMLREASEKTSDSMRLDDFGVKDLDESTGEGITKITDGWTRMGYDKPLFNDDKEINLFELTLPLTSRGLKVLRPLPEISSEEASARTKRALSWH